MNSNRNVLATWIIAASTGAALLLAPPGVAQDAAPPAEHAPEDEFEFELPPAERSALEQGTCRAWHDRALGSVRAFSQYDRQRMSVSFECESHALFRKFPLHAIGDCYRTDGPLHCRKDGLAIDLAFGREKYWMQFGEIPPQTAVDIFEYLRGARWKGKALKAEFADTMSLHPVDTRPGEYWLEIEFSTERDMDLVTIFVNRECKAQRCRYRLTNVNHNHAQFSE